MRVELPCKVLPGFLVVPHLLVWDEELVRRKQDVGDLEDGTSLANFLIPALEVEVLELVNHTCRRGYRASQRLMNHGSSEASSC